ncbi:1-phosphofructokinase family hexose kinase [Nocardia fluminea]|uniref:1-phosphofructokinase family hexose kinase n=1 Tax=Nocardia fluminea TaxID=134984 RepID=UPI0033F04B4B
MPVSPRSVPIATFTVNPTVDLSLVVAHLLPEGKTRAQVHSIRGGGGGINVARCVRRLGGAAVAVHTSGREVGARLERLLDDEQLEHESIEIAEDTREAFVLADNAEGRSYHIVAPGPVLTMTEQQRCLDTIADIAARCDYFVLSGGATPGLSEDFSAAVARTAGARGARLIADIAGAQLTTMLRERVFLLRLDRTEAGRLLGHPVTSFADARAVNTWLLERDACEHAITTVGALGAVCSDSHAHYELAAPTLPSPPRSDACAGDSLVAAVAYRLSRGDRVLDACAVGVAAAAATVVLPGTDVFDPATLESLTADIDILRISGEGRREDLGHPEKGFQTLG